VSDESENELIQRMGRDVHTAITGVIEDTGLGDVVEAMEAIGYQSFIAGYQAAGRAFPDREKWLEKRAQPTGLTLVEEDK
jgi:hypothetical protein